MRRVRYAALIASCIWVTNFSVLAGITIDFDYSLDSNNFFADANAKATLEAAGAFFEGLLDDTLDAINPSGTDTWTISFPHPGTGDNHQIVDKSIAADTLVVFAGARNIDGSSGVLAQADPWSFAAGGSTSFIDGVINRGETGITDGNAVRLATETDFAPGGGMIVFDTSESWHYDANPASIANPTGGMIDFFSVAIHELSHVLGYGSANGDVDNDGSWTGKVTAGEFTGAFSKQANGDANVAMAGTSHWADGTMSVRLLDGAVQEAAMDPSLNTDERKLYTNLDAMGLRDIGWEINIAPVPVPEPIGFATTMSIGLIFLSWRHRRNLDLS